MEGARAKLVHCAAHECGIVEQVGADGVLHILDRHWGPDAVGFGAVKQLGAEPGSEKRNDYFEGCTASLLYFEVETHERFTKLVVRPSCVAAARY